MMTTEPPKPSLIAAIDVGTNSFHMVIAAVSEKGVLQVYTRLKETVRLGSSAKDMKHIESDAIKRGVSVLRRFANVANDAGAVIRAIATSAVREALNREDFVEVVAEKTGIEIEVASGLEEARLIYVGALHALPIFNKKALIVDIGGGSTELVLGRKGERLLTHSAKLGAIRMTQRFFAGGVVSSPKELRACRQHVAGDLAHILEQIRETGVDQIIGTSGTIHAIAAIAVAKKNIRIPEIMNGVVVHKKEMLAAVSDILSAKTPELRSQIFNMDSSRSDIIVGGAIILEQILTQLPTQNIILSSYALREGILFDAVQKQKNIQEYQHLSSLRSESVYHICELYRVDIPHAEQVKRLSVDLFDALQAVHSLSDTEKELLEAAALLHDVGYHISPEQHHKHGYYLISNCVLPGFTNDEAAILANIARYHRKSLPKKKHENFQLLSPTQQKTVSLLSGILRIAEGLDRRQKQSVESITVSVGDKEIVIELRATNSAISLEVEIWASNRRKDLLERSLKKSIKIMQAKA